MSARASLPVEAPGPWARFVRAFRASARARLAWRALLLCVGLAVFAPWLANERPYFARFRDAQGYADALSLLVPISTSVAREANSAGPGLASELRALHARLDVLGAGIESEPDTRIRDGFREYRDSLETLELTLRLNDAVTKRAAGERLRELAPGTVVLLTPRAERLLAQSSWPLFESLSLLDVAAFVAWLGLASMGLWSRFIPALGIRSKLLALAVLALLLGALSQLPERNSAPLDASAWKSRIAADTQSTSAFAPIAFGPEGTLLRGALQAPLQDSAAGHHWCGTDQLGRDLLARLLYAGRTSFAVAFIAALLILALGAALGLAAGALRGAVDFVVLRAIELLQAFPTLVLLLGVVALLPRQVANTRWTIPLAIAAFGWTHIARLARAEALRVSELGFVQAASAAGFSRARVLLRHVLPNSLAPVWIAASFVLSAGLVLESAAAFLGLGIRHPAPSFGTLLAESRATQAWWLALFPGVWLFASILAIHLVGEGVRDALDPRDEGRAP